MKSKRPRAPCTKRMGAYMPLKFWTDKGWPEEAITENSDADDVWEHPKYGVTLYRIPVVSKGETHKTSVDVAIGILQASRKRKLRPALSDESAHSAPKALKMTPEMGAAAAATPPVQEGEVLDAEDDDDELHDSSSESSSSTSNSSSSSADRKKKKKGKKSKKKGKKSKKKGKKDKGMPSPKAALRPVSKAEAKAKAKQEREQKAAADKELKKEKDTAARLAPRVRKALEGLKALMSRAGIQHVPDVTKAPALRLIEEYSTLLRDLQRVEKGLKRMSPEFADFCAKDAKEVEKPIVGFLKLLTKHNQ